MSHITDAFNYYIASGNPGNIVFSSTPQDINNWYKEYKMARRNKELNFRVEDVENGFIVTLGNEYNGNYSGRYVFSTIKDLNDFIAKKNAEELE